MTEFQDIFICYKAIEILTLLPRLEKIIAANMELKFCCMLYLRRQCKYLDKTWRLLYLLQDIRIQFSWISFIYLLTSYQMKGLLTKYVPTTQLSCIEKLTAVYWTFCIVINMEICISLSNRIEMVCCPPTALHFIMPARHQDIKFNPYLIWMFCISFPLSNLVPLKPIKCNLYNKMGVLGGYFQLRQCL